MKHMLLTSRLSREHPVRDLEQLAQTWRSPRLVRPTVTHALPPPRTLPLGGACYLPWRGLSCLGGGELCHKATRHHSRRDGALLMRPLVVAAGAPSARRLREWPLAAAAAAAAADRSGPSSRAYCRAARSAVSKLPQRICLTFSPNQHLDLLPLQRAPPGSGR